MADLQRARMLSSALQVVMHEGYGRMSVARVTGAAGVSRRTFYEIFEDREACFLAAFDQAVAEMTTVATDAWHGEQIWREQVRAALAALLGFLDQQPGVGSLVIVEALGAGPRVLARRAGLIVELAQLVDRGHGQARKQREPAPLTAEGIVGAVLSVIHSRLLESGSPPLSTLLNPLMRMILEPYLGVGVAARELERPVPIPCPSPAPASHGNPLAGLKIRVTYRTLRVLKVVGEHPSASNRKIADRAGVADQGQISKLLTRLEGLGLIENTISRQPNGEPNRWRLTRRGEELVQTLGVQQPTEAAGGVGKPAEQKVQANNRQETYS